MIRHLAGGGPERRDVLTECSLTSALPGSLVVDLEAVNCRDCRASLVGRGVCPACGEERLSWGTHPHKLTTVPDGRLTARDLETVFYLACDYCSETVIPLVEPDVVAAALTEARWRPSQA